MGVGMLLAGGGPLLLAAAFTLQAGAQGVDRSCSDSSITFDLVSDFEIVVQGQVGGITGLRFILDSGSSYSAIDRRVAESLGLHRRPGRVFNFDRNLPIEWADVPEFQIGTVRVAGPHDGHKAG